jgi:hypothetical protein
MINDLWYKNAVIYSLSVATYMDADGDGIGDFRGLLRRLDYLQGMGVTALWLNRDRRCLNALGDPGLPFWRPGKQRCSLRSVDRQPGKSVGFYSGDALIYAARVRAGLVPARRKGTRNRTVVARLNCSNERGGIPGASCPGNALLRFTSRGESIHAIRSSCMIARHERKAGVGGLRFVCNQVSAGGCWRAPAGLCGCSCS